MDLLSQLVLQYPSSDSEPDEDSPPPAHTSEFRSPATHASAPAFTFTPATPIQRFPTPPPIVQDPPTPPSALHNPPPPAFRRPEAPPRTLTRLPIPPLRPPPSPPSDAYIPTSLAPDVLYYASALHTPEIVHELIARAISPSREPATRPPPAALGWLLLALVHLGLDVRPALALARARAGAPCAYCGAPVRAHTNGPRACARPHAAPPTVVRVLVGPSCTLGEKRTWPCCGREEVVPAGAPRTGVCDVGPHVVGVVERAPARPTGAGGAPTPASSAAVAPAPAARAQEAVQHARPLPRSVTTPPARPPSARSVRQRAPGAEEAGQQLRQQERPQPDPQLEFRPLQPPTPVVQSFAPHQPPLARLQGPRARAPSGLTPGRSAPAPQSPQAQSPAPPRAPPAPPESSALPQSMFEFRSLKLPPPPVRSFASYQPPQAHLQGSCVPPRSPGEIPSRSAPAPQSPQVQGPAPPRAILPAPPESSARPRFQFEFRPLQPSSPAVQSFSPHQPPQARLQGSRAPPPSSQASSRRAPAPQSPQGSTPPRAPPPAPPELSALAESPALPRPQFGFRPPQPPAVQSFRPHQSPQARLQGPRAPPSSGRTLTRSAPVPQIPQGLASPRAPPALLGFAPPVREFYAREDEGDVGARMDTRSDPVGSHASGPFPPSASAPSHPPYPPPQLQPQPQFRPQPTPMVVWAHTPQPPRWAQ